MQEIDGVRFVDIPSVEDHRGKLFSFLSDAVLGTDFPQWNFITSKEKVLRGVHAHYGYDEYYIPLVGSMFFALIDIRKESNTFLNQMSWYWDGRPQAVVVPKGVAHGVYGDTPYVLAYGLSTLYSGEGEFGCRFDSAGLDINWPNKQPVLSEKDSASRSLTDMIDAYAKQLLLLES